MRLLLAGPFYHDLDFVNSLPVVASQLDRLGLCDPRHLGALRDYCANRAQWFEEIIEFHAIPELTGLHDTAKDVAKRRCRCAYCMAAPTPRGSKSSV